MIFLLTYYGWRRGPAQLRLTKKLRLKMFPGVLFTVVRKNTEVRLHLMTLYT